MSNKSSGGRSVESERVTGLESALKRSSEKQDRQKNWNDLHKLERELLGLGATDRRPNGICLSGGGVRSAVTCMGVLACLARRNILEHVHYVSSVSGGGYAASALSTWLHGRAEPGETFGSEAESGDPQAEPPEQSFGARLPDKVKTALKVPFVVLSNRSASTLRRKVNIAGDTPAFPSHAPKFSGRDLLSQNEAYIRHVRANISFLMPSGFTGVLVGGYAVLRAVLLNIFVWLVFTSFLFLALIDPLKAFSVLTTIPGSSYSSLSGMMADLVSSMRMGAAEMNAGLSPFIPFGWAFVSGIALIGLLLAQMVGYSIATTFKSHVTQHSRAEEPNGKAGRLPFNYSWRRGNERLARWLLLISMVLIGFGAIPWLAANLGDVAAFLGETSDAAAESPVDLGTPAEALSTNTVSVIPGTIATLIGIASSLVVFVRTRLGKVIGPKSSILVLLGSLLLVYGIAILSFVFALQISTDSFPLGLATVLVALALVLAWACNINDVSLGRFYRDRLMEAFIPDLDKVWNASPGAKLVEIAPPAVKADRLRLTDLRGQTRCIRPLHLVNTNVMCWWTDDTRARRRKGDNFIASAVGTGSDTTGWRMTQHVADGKLTLATAMAASGAAVNPRGGFSGTGPTTLLPVSLAMALLSIRLGYWLRWRKPTLPLFRLNRFGNRINPPALQFLGSILAAGGLRKQTPNFVELTDGGHFENLGLYELIRRKCRIIIICDAGEDPETSYSGFTSAIRRVREDFGAEIQFDMERDLAPSNSNKTKMVDTGPADLVARKVDNQYPSGAEYAKKGYFLASVTYHDNPGVPGMDGFRATASPSADGTAEQGLIIYLKSAMIPSLEVTTKGYKGANALFPYDPTSNQFFSPEQFEAYFDMGEKIAEQMINDTHLDKQLATGRKFDDTLLANAAFRKKVSMS